MLRAGDGISRDAGWIIIRSAGNDAGPERTKKAFNQTRLAVALLTTHGALRFGLEGVDVDLRVSPWKKRKFL